MAVTRYPATNMFTATAQEAVTTERLFVTNIHWYGATTAGHKIQATNTAGGVIVNHTISTTNEIMGMSFADIILPVNRWVNGVTLSDLDSGTVDIHYE